MPIGGTTRRIGARIGSVARNMNRIIQSREFGASQLAMTRPIIMIHSAMMSSRKVTMKPTTEQSTEGRPPGPNSRGGGHRADHEESTMHPGGHAGAVAPPDDVVPHPPARSTAPAASSRAAIRAAALLVPAAAVITGALAPGHRIAGVAALASGLAATAWAVPLAIRSRRPPREAFSDATLPQASTLPRLLVMVPARDEAAVIADLLGDLGRQDHRDPDGAPRFDVVIVDDRSSDGTGATAVRALEAAGLGESGRVMHRRDGPDGKAAALSMIPLDGPPDDGIVVFDADARIDPAFLRRAAAYLESGLPALTARRRMLPRGPRPVAPWFVRAQDDEQTIDGEIQRGRWAMGGASEFRGDGMVLARSHLERAGGWDSAALTEDLELSTHLFARSGTSVAWTPDLVVWEQPVDSLRALWRQRLRWAEGMVRRQLRLTTAVLASPRLSARQKVDYAAYSAQSLAPLSAIGLALRARDPRARRLLVAAAALYVFPGLLLGVDALRETAGDGERGSPPRLPERLGRAGLALVLSAVWLPAFPVAWLRVGLGRGPVRFAKTDHASGWRPPSRHGT